MHVSCEPIEGRIGRDCPRGRNSFAPQRLDTVKIQSLTSSRELLFTDPQRGATLYAYDDDMYIVVVPPETP